MKIGVLFSRLRVEEKWIFEALEKRGVDYDRIDDRHVSFNLTDPGEWSRYNAILIRSLSYRTGLYAAQVLNSWGIPTVNSAQVAATCGDKLATTAALVQAGIPQPQVWTAFSAEAALEIMDRIGYPVVLKPLVGSWGRLLSKVNDRDAAETILEHKEVMGGPQHGIFYIQEFVHKPGRDIRSFVIGDRTVCAIYREAEHWITNTARGGKEAARCAGPPQPQLSRANSSAGRTVLGGTP